MSAIFPMPMLASLAAGAALGVFYFYVLYRAVRLHAARAAIGVIVLLTLVRVGAAIGVFWVIALYGAMPLLLGLAGFLMTRLLVQHWSRSLP